MINTNISGPVAGCTVYSESNLVGRDVAVTLPEIVPQTADLALMGTYTKPIWALIDHMEAEFTRIGVDKGLGKMLSPGSKSLEVRWAQDGLDATGKSKTTGCKAFLTGECSKIPGISLEVGSPVELPATFGLTRYQLFADGKEVFLVDRIAGIVRIDGKDYANLSAYL